MKLDKNFERFRAAIVAIQNLLGRQNDQGVIIGGIAASFLGKPRLTADVDAMFLLSTAQSFGIKSRSTFPRQTMGHSLWGNPRPARFMEADRTFIDD